MENFVCEEGRLIQGDLRICELAQVELVSAISNRSTGDLQLSQSEMAANCAELLRNREIWEEHLNCCDQCSSD